VISTSNSSIAFGEQHIAVVNASAPDAVWPLKVATKPTYLGGDASGPRTAVSFGRYDQELVLARGDGEVQVQENGLNAHTLPHTHSAAVRVLALSPGRKFLATGGDDGLIALWDTKTWQKLGELRGHAEAVTALQFSPDGNRLVSGSKDRTVIVWDVRERTAWATLRGHSRGVTHVAWGKAGGTVVSAGPDGMVVWGLDVDQALRALG
jgi:WD40 repeat protein